MNVRKKVLAAVAACALALPVVAAAGATAKPDYSTALVGRWDLTVTIHIQEPPLYAPLFCDFTADYLLHCVTKPGNPDQLEGRGVWTMAKDGQFSFWITHHAHRDENGNPVGSINASHLGRISPNKKKFTTRAHTYIDMHDGTPWQGPVPVEGDAFRI
ncbi:hypothetical protein [Lentzea sp. NPDC060358]|uniref:hypothetical protein n=1 Tax=Lentzea sp. NPDC060358 TaxID=3347103 RepID=UPI003669CE60